MGIAVKSVSDLITGKIAPDDKCIGDKYEFFIPDYQRGYRWGTTQATELLDDIYEFSLKMTDEFYCLQPIVVAYNDARNKYDVIDGQQRLTTLLILLKCLDLVKEGDMSYSIQYQTRDGSEQFLNKILDKNQDDAEKNSDYHCMYCVRNTIQAWIEQKNKENKDLAQFKSKLKNNVYFIWYRTDNDKAQEVFTRLNVGKIPLTSSELIKALFLNRSNFGGDDIDPKRLKIQQGKIAMKWDSIEYALQDDEFRFFIHEAEYNNPTRMDYILDLIRIHDGFELKVHDNRFGNDGFQTFRYFHEYFARSRQNKKINEEWMEQTWGIIKKYFSIFEEWYNDDEIFHHLGFLLAKSGPKESLVSFIKEWESKDKTAFKTLLKDKITAELRSKKWMTKLKTAQFEESQCPSKTECYNLLLLHNIYTIVTQNQRLMYDPKFGLPNFTRFAFHLLKKQELQKRKWEIEHIRPDSGDRFNNDNDIRVYLAMTKLGLEKLNLQAGDDLKDYEDKIADLLDYTDELKADNQTFMDIIQGLDSFDGDTLGEKEKNRVCNYVLLDGITNCEYGNLIFPIKRLFIREKERGYRLGKPTWDRKNKKIVLAPPKQEAAYITPCVKNVFTKFYTDCPANMRNWTNDDAHAYLEDIIAMVKFYGIDQDNVVGGNSNV